MTRRQFNLPPSSRGRLSAPFQKILSLKRKTYAAINVLKNSKVRIALALPPALPFVSTTLPLTTWGPIGTLAKDAAAHFSAIEQLLKDANVYLAASKKAYFERLKVGNIFSHESVVRHFNFARRDLR